MDTQLQKTGKLFSFTFYSENFIQNNRKNSGFCFRNRLRQIDEHPVICYNNNQLQQLSYYDMNYS